MERIGFIGTYDKTDFIIYVARVLVELGKKVLVIVLLIKKQNMLFQL